MALPLTTTASGTYIMPLPGKTLAASAFTPSVEAEVNGTVLTSSRHVRNSGVFTQGTVNEGGIVQQDSNA